MAESEGTPPSLDELREVALEVIRQILKAYNFEEDDEEEGGVDRDYRVNVVDEDHVLTLDVDANEKIRGILIGRGGANVTAMERILISALHRRFNLGRDQKLGRAIRLSVNGTRPDARRENGDRQKPVVVVTVPRGVRVLTQQADE